MASRTVVLLLLLSAIGADVLAANLPSLTSRHLRNDPFQATVDDESGGTSVDNPELDIPELAESRRSLQDIVISSQCLNTLAASSDKNGNLGPENFYVFTDGMSNGYFSTNNMKDYGSLPMQNKFAFVTLSCQCQLMGLRDNCCQGLRARIRVAGIDPENPESMNEQLQQYVSDICSTTLDAIGEENILPPLAELADDPTCKLVTYIFHPLLPLSTWYPRIKRSFFLPPFIISPTIARTTSCHRGRTRSRGDRC